MYELIKAIGIISGMLFIQEKSLNQIKKETV